MIVLQRLFHGLSLMFLDRNKFQMHALLKKTYQNIPENMNTWKKHTHLKTLKPNFGGILNQFQEFF